MDDVAGTTGKTAKAAVENTAETAPGIEHVAVDAAHTVAAKIRHFLQLPTAGGIILIAATVAALAVANSGLNPLYHYIFNEIYFSIGFSSPDGLDMELHKPLLLWINDGLMAIFFLLVGLEIKKEIVDGELSSRSRALFPAAAAIGGMAVPMAIFWLINHDSAYNMDGIAIPAATDIAFALGVLSLVRRHVPVGLKILLTSIAIIDDIGAILIIALFYSSHILITPLFFAGGTLLILFMMNRQGVTSIAAYLLAGSLLWLAILESGIHATLAGVVTALFIPMRVPKKSGVSPCETLLHDLYPLVSFVVVPLFAFANAGVSFRGMGMDDLFHPVTTGIVAGLILGKQIGIFAVLWGLIAAGVVAMPKNVSWSQLYAVSVLCGIGFTMSLFIGELAYGGIEMQQHVRTGVLVASAVSALAGYGLMMCCGKQPRQEFRAK